MEEEDSRIMENLFKLFDADGSNTVDMKEFILALSASCASATKEERVWDNNIKY
jgi:Ca2+-binding EF-hand superfamily protein